MSLDVKQYNAVEKWCRKQVSLGAAFLFDPVLFHDALYRASKDFDIPFEVRSCTLKLLWSVDRLSMRPMVISLFLCHQALHSFFRNIHLLHVRKTTHLVKGRIDQIAQKYTKGESILNLSIANNYPPYLFCRILVEAITSNQGSRRSLTDAMRDPFKHLGDAKIILPEYSSSEDAPRSDGHSR